MKFTCEEVVEHLNKLLAFFEPVQSLANSHFASFFSENVWDNEVPIEILSELNNAKSLNDFIRLYPEIIQNNCPNEFLTAHPHLWSFVITAVNISLTNEEKYSKALLHLENLFLTDSYSEKCDFTQEEFMSKKKLHEVKRTSKMTAILSNLTGSSHIVDVGGGKGYLSSILALQHSFKVLGLDSSEVTTCGAIKRSEKVAKLWNSHILIKGSSPSEEKLNKKAKEDFMRRHYKQVITFVRPDTSVENLLKECFSEEPKGITLTGLHTCGNLAPTCLQMFLNNEEIKAVVNVGCCYHLVSEEFPRDKCNNEIAENYGFPMSSYLRGKKYSLGRNARMLAAHSLNRMSSKSEWESSGTSLFYRAVLETVIKNRQSQQHHVGKLAKKCKNFYEYLLKAVKKLDINLQVTENDANKLLESFEEKKPILAAFFLLRVTLAPIIESIILLDRTLYLIENGVSNAYLVRLFDLETSPRGFGIIAWKDQDTC